MPRFKGFTTIDRCKKFSLVDHELIKRDLLNSFLIREGELPGRPEFGTRIWGFIFEPNVEDIQQQIIAEVERVVRYDPRVTLNDMKISIADHEIILDLVVTINPNVQPEVLRIKFDEEAQTAYFG